MPGRSRDGTKVTITLIEGHLARQIQQNSLQKEKQPSDPRGSQKDGEDAPLRHRAPFSPAFLGGGTDEHWNPLSSYEEAGTTSLSRVSVNERHGSTHWVVLTTEACGIELPWESNMAVRMIDVAPADREWDRRSHSCNIVNRYYWDGIL